MAQVVIKQTKKISDLPIITDQCQQNDTFLMQRNNTSQQIKYSVLETSLQNGLMKTINDVRLTTSNLCSTVLDNKRNVENVENYLSSIRQELDKKPSSTQAGRVRTGFTTFDSTKYPLQVDDAGRAYTIVNVPQNTVDRKEIENLSSNYIINSYNVLFNDIEAVKTTGWKGLRSVQTEILDTYNKINSNFDSLNYLSTKLVELNSYIFREMIPYIAENIKNINVLSNFVLTDVLAKIESDKKNINELYAKQQDNVNKITQLSLYFDNLAIDLNKTNLSIDFVKITADKIRYDLNTTDFNVRELSINVNSNSKDINALKPQVSELLVFRYNSFAFLNPLKVFIDKDTTEISDAFRTSLKENTLYKISVDTETKQHQIGNQIFQDNSILIGLVDKNQDKIELSDFEIYVNSHDADVLSSPTYNFKTITQNIETLSNDIGNLKQKSQNYNILNLVYPINSVYTTTSPESITTIFGEFGQWEKINSCNCLYSVSDDLDLGKEKYMNKLNANSQGSISMYGVNIWKRIA